MDYFKIFIIYFLAVNLFSFILFYVDKMKAKKDKWRIQEKTLHLSSFIGGSIGSIAAMFLFHHKTKKINFCLITLIAFAFNIFVIYKLFNLKGY